MEVKFENLTISANVQVGSRALPTLINYSRDVLEVYYVFSHFTLALDLSCTALLLMIIAPPH